jgi:hypothetical protein
MGASAAPTSGAEAIATHANTAVLDRPRLIRLAAVGLVAGLFAALFGVGGGVVMVPLLIAMLHYDVRAATATSLAAVIFTASAAAITHGALGNVDWDRAVLIGIPAMAGVLLGLAVKRRMSSAALTYAFAALMVLVALRMLLAEGGLADPTDLARAEELLLVVVLGVIAGAVASVFGVGGGIVFVPTLVLVLGMEQLPAEATSLLAIVPVALLGSWRQSREGLVAWRDAVTIGLISICTAVAGGLTAEALPERALEAGFAALLIATAAHLVISTRGAQRGGRG